MSKTENNQNNQELDLRGVMCPYNYVKTKIKLETMEVGEILSVIVDDGEPIRNVPRSVMEDGQSIVKQEKLEKGFRILIKKQV